MTGSTFGAAHDVVRVSHLIWYSIAAVIKSLIVGSILLRSPRVGDPSCCDLEYSNHDHDASEQPVNPGLQRVDRCCHGGIGTFAVCHLGLEVFNVLGLAGKVEAQLATLCGGFRQGIVAGCDGGKDRRV